MLPPKMSHLSTGKKSREVLTSYLGCVGELKEDLFSKFSFFKEHVRIKQIQSTAFTEDKKRSDCHVLQCDFATAYSCDYQNEVQSAL